MEKLLKQNTSYAIAEEALLTQMEKLQAQMTVVGRAMSMIPDNARQALFELRVSLNQQQRCNYVLTWLHDAPGVFNELWQAIQMIEHILKLLKVLQRQVAKLSEDGIDEAMDVQLSDWFKSVGRQAQEVSIHLYAFYDFVPTMCEAFQVAIGSKLHEQFQETRNHATRLLVQLAKTTFVVTTEPYARRKEGCDNFYNSYQVITLGNNVKCVVKLLAGFRGRRDAELDIKAHVLRDRKLDSEIAVSQDTCLKPTETTKRDESSVCELTASFDSMHCDFIKGKKRRAVANLSYNLFFICKIKINDEIQSLTCLSLPVAMIANVSQECESRSKLFWDNAFWSLKIGDKCHCVTADKKLHYCGTDMKAPEYVNWQEFYSELAHWFQSLTDCTLNEIHENFIKSCVSDPKTGLVPFRKFYNSDTKKEASSVAEPESPLKVTFWIWFFNIRKFVKKQSFLKFLWKNGLLHGFATHLDASRLMLEGSMNTKEQRNAFHKTMLLRFSNSTEEAALVITYGNRDKASSQLIVKSLEPWESKMLEKQHENLHSKLKKTAGNRYKYIYPLRDWQKACENYEKPSKQSQRQKQGPRPDYESVLPDSDGEDLPEIPGSWPQTPVLAQSPITRASPGSSPSSHFPWSVYPESRLEPNDLNVRHDSQRFLNSFQTATYNLQHSPFEYDAILKASLLDDSPLRLAEQPMADHEMDASEKVQIDMKEYSGSHTVSDLTPSLQIDSEVESMTTEYFHM